jgi:hypothetical protein
MSIDFGTIDSIKRDGIKDESLPISISSFNAGKVHGKCVQLSIGDKYCSLDSYKVKELIYKIQSAIGKKY